MIYCPECDKNMKVVNFVRDDPILECGHTKTISGDAINRIIGTMEDLLRQEAKRRNISFEEIIKEIIPS